MAKEKASFSARLAYLYIPKPHLPASSDTAGIGTLRFYAKVAGFHRARPSTALDKAFSLELYAAFPAARTIIAA